MPFRTVKFFAGGFYHVFNRGNNKEPIFFERRDYERFLEKAAEYKITYSLEILAYCLLSNHLHFLVRQTKEITINRFFGTLLNSHARYTSIKHGNAGHLFQGRFKANLVADEASLFQVSRYIHLNPIKERILALPSHRRAKNRRELTQHLKEALRRYPWSSYPLYLQTKEATKDNPLVDRRLLLDSFGTPSKYRRFVEADLDIEELCQLEGLA